MASLGNTVSWFPILVKQWVVSLGLNDILWPVVQRPDGTVHSKAIFSNFPNLSVDHKLKFLFWVALSGLRTSSPGKTPIFASSVQKLSTTLPAARLFSVLKNIQRTLAEISICFSKNNSWSTRKQSVGWATNFPNPSMIDCSSIVSLRSKRTSLKYR